MKRSKSLCHELPLFADTSLADPAHVWETLDDAIRQQLIERVASLLLAHAKADARRSAPTSQPQQ
jgi:hypothetical protein